MDVPHEMLGKDKVVISLRDFKNMLDIITYDHAKSQIEETFPASFTLRLVYGENPLKAFRTHRKLSQVELHKRSGIGQGLISEIETGKKQGSVNTLKALAKALDIEVDDLL